MDSSSSPRMKAASSSGNSEDNASGINNNNQYTYQMKASDYELGKAIGFGSSGIVYVAMYKPLAGKKVSVKMIDLDRFERNQIDELRKEIQLMTLCKHNNLLPIHTSFVNESKLWIVTPLLSAGSCLDIMKSAFPDGFEEPVIAAILSQALQGLDYLHKNNLIHRDIKAGNLLMDENGIVQLADFGVSSSLSDEGDRKNLRKTFVGTPCWMAPEVMEMSRGYDFRADIWSFGITAFELFQGHAPYSKYPPMKVIFLTMNNEPPSLKRKETKKRNSKQFAELINLCLQKDPTKRGSCETLIKLSFIKNAKKPAFLAAQVATRIPPIEERSKSEPFRLDDNTSESEQTWDFSGDEDERIWNRTSSNTALEKKDGGDETNAPKKKTSRFVIDGNTNAINTSALNSSSSNNPVSSPVDSNSSASAAEVKKGRFSVINPVASVEPNPPVPNANVLSLSSTSSQAVAKSVTGTTDATGSTGNPNNSQATPTTPLKSISSSDSLVSMGPASDVKSSRRTFEVRSVPIVSEGSGSSSGTASVNNGASGSSAAQTKDPNHQVVGRFTVNNANPNPNSSTSSSNNNNSNSANPPTNTGTSHAQITASESSNSTSSQQQQRGRFKVSSRESSSSINIANAEELLLDVAGGGTGGGGGLQQSAIEGLLRSCENQKQMLLSLLAPSTANTPQTRRSNSSSSAASVSSTLEALTRQIHTLVRENEDLKKENERLLSKLQQQSQS